MSIRAGIFVAGVSLFYAGVALSENHQQTFSVELGASRVIYPLNGRNTSVRVENKQDYPILVKSQVLLASDKKGGAPFITTPPLFRLDSHQTSVVTITRTGGDYPADRESLNWLCVTAVPPDKDAEWAKGADEKGVANNIQVVLKNCIKLLVRPDALSNNPADIAGKVVWKTEGKNLHAHNPTPYYMNISGVRFNDEQLKLKDSYIAPFSDVNIPVSSVLTKGREVKWTVIGDYGERKEMKSDVE
ncbi:molecular chaperone [Salmonella enterica]|uniref:Molecular chaperone n=2 Tax=Salmonella enterica TaxID=28901 RepID=A0A603XVH6_SALER|nr:molecular chaperone [Salmonella enterica subsp. enterica serovar Java]EAN9729153.1 molecular chaperone [Salmonella enterica]EBV8394801.1 molecular chaperone [Salmonella enterica subsp. enterica serovar Virchow]EDQ0183450.1 molecular chaperone [Salmonella enterica subsp. enterica serovar 4,[5],12:b:-]EDV9618107.1 molecular chaperone [Salmonella enterica subsp. enterica serovar Paratyphi B]EEE5613367.1 fimbria/pilus periplasmic chaperone [Salmonella enterica subsp. enterica serovar Typhimuriu